MKMLNFSEDFKMSLQEEPVAKNLPYQDGSMM